VGVISGLILVAPLLVTAAVVAWLVWRSREDPVGRWERSPKKGTAGFASFDGESFAMHSTHHHDAADGGDSCADGGGDGGACDGGGGDAGGGDGGGGGD
jgi:hypothetical protein